MRWFAACFVHLSCRHEGWGSCAREALLAVTESRTRMASHTRKAFVELDDSRIGVAVLTREAFVEVADSSDEAYDSAIGVLVT